jgi:glycosyltransferase involved in cell wall biosynthesis
MENAMRERVSVIIPNLNMGAFLDAALRSIARQSTPVHEVILVDNGSTDGTFEVAERHRGGALNLKVLECPRRGAGPARNLGVAAAEGDMIAFLDADDLWPAGKLERQLARLRARPAVQMVTGYACYFEEAGEDGLEPAPGSRTERLFHVFAGACVYRRETFAKIGGAFDEDFLYTGEDTDLLLRLREADVPFTILRSIELYYRQHPASMMAQNDPRKHGAFRNAVRKSLLRRRAAGTLDVPLRAFASYLEPERE